MKKTNLFRTSLCIFISLLVCCVATAAAGNDNDKPLRIAVAGVAHGHLNDVLSRMDRGDFEVVGVYEKDDRMRQDNGSPAAATRFRSLPTSAKCSTRPISRLSWHTVRYTTTWKWWKHARQEEYT